jgi:hypothetical protein
MRDSFAFSAPQKIYVRLRQAVAGSAHPRRILSFESLASSEKKKK